MENNFDPSKNFLRNQEYRQNQQLLRIYRCFITVPVVLLICKVTNLFSHLSYVSLGIITFWLVANYLCALLLVKEKPYSPVTKYIALLSIEVLILFISVTQGLYVFVVYLLVPLFSCLYLNRTFSLQIIIFSYIGMVVTLWYRAFYIMPFDGYTVDPKIWFTNFLVSLTIGFLINGIIIFVISKRNREIVRTDSHEIELNLRAQNTIVSSYVAMLCAKSASLEGHVKRCSEYIRVMLSYLQTRKEYAGVFTENFSYQIISCSLLHDIGMISVPDTLLKRNTPLSDEEKEQLKMHPILGEKLLSENMRAVDPEYFSVACDMVLYHHENWDGSGYPFGRKGEEIPFSARLMAVANTLDSLTGKRPDQAAGSFDDAIEKLDGMAGTQLDPYLVHVALKNEDKLREVYEKLKDY